MKSLLKKFLAIFALSIFIPFHIENTCLGMEVYTEDKQDENYTKNPEFLFNLSKFKSISEWNRCSFKDALEETFPNVCPTPNYEAQNMFSVYTSILTAINNSCESKRNFINKIEEKRKDLVPKKHKDHIAIARVVVCLKNNRCCVYPIPYLFFSGISIGIKDLVVKQKLPNVCCKNITSYKFDVISKNIKFCHSERAAGLCLLKDHVFNITDITKLHQKEGISKIIIQIKNMYEMCNSCKKFWTDKVYVSTKEKVHIFQSEQKDENKCFSIIDSLKEKIDTSEVILEIHFSKQEDVLRFVSRVN